MYTSRYIKSNLQKQILDLIFSFLSPNNTTIVLFGSQTEKNQSRYSDIDIGIISKERIKDKTFLTLIEQLNYKVDTLKRLDLVEFSRVDNEFKEFALKNAEIWHTAKN